MTKNIIIIHEPSQSEPYLILSKPRGLPSAPLKYGDESAYTQAEKLFPALKNVVGKKNVEHGLIHRIDTETEGLLLIASTQLFYDYMQDVQDKGLFIKTYNAVCTVKKETDLKNFEKGFPSAPFIDFTKTDFNYAVRSRFRPYGVGRKEVRPVEESSGKAALKKASSVIYETYVSGKFNEEHSLCDVTCTISKGYRHQVRCHLAWIGLPIKGDPLYSNVSAKSEYNEKFFFTASGFKFPYIDGTEKSFFLNARK